jgi:hypothetical protein
MICLIIDDKLKRKQNSSFLDMIKKNFNSSVNLNELSYMHEQF